MQNKIFSNSIIYAVCGLLLKCFSFFLLPLYTAYLTTEDYGITSISNSFVSTMGFVIAFSLFSAVLRFYVELKDNPEKTRAFLWNNSIIRVFIGKHFCGNIFSFERFSFKIRFFPD